MCGVLGLATKYCVEALICSCDFHLQDAQVCLAHHIGGAGGVFDKDKNPHNPITGQP